MQRLALGEITLSAVTAGVVATVVGFSSSVAVVYEAATALGATDAQVSSWIWALGLGMGLCTVGASLWLRQPLVVAWSTPGAAVLATAGLSGGFGLAQATGAFMVSALLVVIFGATGWFERVLDRIPLPIANALLAGVVARFGLDAFIAMRSALVLVLLMFAAYLIGRRLWPRYAVPGVLLVGVGYAAATGQLHPAASQWGLTTPVFTGPEFTWRATVSLALPLFVVTMTSQNLPGVAAIRAAGYVMPISKVITLTGLATLLLAPFGAFALNLAAITAAICMGREAHPDPSKRYIAAVSSGLIYCVLGLFGASVVAGLTAFPRELVVAIAGFALLGSISAGLVGALSQDAYREAALITFLVTLSGLSLGGVGSAFWGVVAGAVAVFVQKWRPR